MTEFEFWVNLLVESRPFFYVMFSVLAALGAIVALVAFIERMKVYKLALTLLVTSLVLGYGYYVVTERLLFEVIK